MPLETRALTGVPNDRVEAKVELIRADTRCVDHMVVTEGPDTKMIVYVMRFPDDDSG